MATCEGIIPEQTVPVRSVVVVDDNGNAVFDEDGHQVKEIITETTPEHPCEAEATVLARSMREVECSEGFAHWVKAGDARYCSRHFVAGTMTYLSGLVAQHPAMAVADA